MRTVLAIALVLTGLSSAALPTAAVAAEGDHPKPHVKRHHVKRPDPENATVPEKKDWISQTIGDVLDGIDDLGRPLRDQRP